MLDVKWPLKVASSYHKFTKAQKIKEETPFEELFPVDMHVDLQGYITRQG
jgi:hypothetical protein